LRSATPKLPHGRGAESQPEAVEATIARAPRDGHVDVVIAHRLAELSASTAVLVRSHFVRIAAVADPDGSVEDDVWRRERSLR